ncbi:hypothetical protein IAD21_05715 [Abditibacteriota bacterium]|nr:hypothetical protein IAD21_05715 [Abditibacteriota bacterium]
MTGKDLAQLTGREQPFKKFADDWFPPFVAVAGSLAALLRPVPTRKRNGYRVLTARRLKIQLRITFADN